MAPLGPSARSKVIAPYLIRKRVRVPRGAIYLGYGQGTALARERPIPAEIKSEIRRRRIEMLKLYIWLNGLLKGERGQDLVEYALITAVLSIVIIVAVMALLGPAFTTWAEGVRDCIQAPSTCSVF